MSPYIDKWPQAMALGLAPQNVKTTFSLLNSISDEIWYLSGDKSTDMDWYAKRLMLMKIYVATETYMLTDKSTDYADTWEFLDRRLSDAKSIRDVFNGDAGSFATSVGTGLTSIASIFSPQNLNMNDDQMRKMQEEMKENKKE